MIYKNKNRNYYIQIADWMLDFGLPINELLTYAIIYGYCQTGKNCYYGSTKTMAELLGLDMDEKGHASEYLNSLEEKGLLHKEEIKLVDKQKMCKYYVTTDREGKVEEQNVDYITIQPWMLNRFRNGLLIVYARIQNLSRSRNIYFYSPDDLRKWLNTKCANKELKRSYIKKLLDCKAIRSVELDDIEAYKAIIPSDIEQNINDSNNGELVPIKSEDVDGVKNGTLVGKAKHLNENSVKNGTHGVRNGTNNLNTLISDNLDDIITEDDFNQNNKMIILKQTDIESNFDIERMQKSYYVQKEIQKTLEANRYSSDSIAVIIKTLKLIIKTANVWSYPNIKKMNNMSDKHYKELYETAVEFIDKELIKCNGNENINTPEKLISIKIGQIIKYKYEEKK